MSENVAIAVIAPVQPEDFYDKLWEGVWEATFDLAAFGVRVENWTTERSDIAKQREILEKLLGEEVSAIAIVPAHTSALDQLINQHELRGTPVITFKTDAPGSKRSAFVGADAHKSGALAGEVLVKLMGGCGHIVSFPGDQQEFQRSGRYAGLRAELIRHAERITETASRLPQEPGTELPPALGELLKTASGIYVGAPELAGVAAALKQTGMQIPCVGFSNTPQARQLMASGMLSAVVDEGRHLQGYFAVQKAYQATLKRDGLQNTCVPSGVAFSANAAELQESLNDAFELLVRQRTEVLCSYKTRLEEANAQLLSLSITDPLTGLLNRRQYEASLQQEVARAHRYGPMSVLLLDVNRFKAVNDTYGHQTGDEVLKAVGSVLRACCRSTDICARLGGDEFGIILPHSDRTAAAVVRKRIMRGMGGLTVPVGQQIVKVSVSVGIGTLPGDADDATALMAVADADMYRVKESSRAPLAVVS